jgi:hypothetical protein
MVNFAVKVLDELNKGLGTKVQLMATTCLRGHPVNIMVQGFEISIVVNIAVEYTYCSTPGQWNSPGPGKNYTATFKGVELQLSSEAVAGASGGESLNDPRGWDAIVKARDATLNYALKQVTPAGDSPANVVYQVKAAANTQLLSDQSATCKRVTTWDSLPTQAH